MSKRILCYRYFVTRSSKLHLHRTFEIVFLVSRNDIISDLAHPSNLVGLMSMNLIAEKYAGVSPSPHAFTDDSIDLFAHNVLQDIPYRHPTESTTLSSSNVTSHYNVSSREYLETFAWSPDLWLRHSPSISAIFCLAYSLVFLMGVIGNSFVVAVVMRSPGMRTVTNYFIVNLALADILVLMFCLPATLVGNLFVPWILGMFMCKTVSFLQGVSVSASINTLVAVSVDRFLAICYPLRCQMSRRSARRIIVVIWLFSLLIAFPWALYFTLIPTNPDFPNIQLCVEIWPSEVSETVYFVVANMLLCYLFPLCIITACYVAIWWKVWRRNIPGDSKNNHMNAVIQRSKLKVVKMMIVVVVIFVLSWLPLYIIFARIKLGDQFVPGSFEEQLIMVTAPVAQWLGASNSCINPVLYAFFNQKFRRGFMAIVKSKKCCGSIRYEMAPNRGTTMRSGCRLTTKIDTQCEYLSTASL